MEEVKAFISSLGIPVEKNTLLDTLSNLGVNKIADLQDVEIDDLSETGLSTIQKRKLIRCIKEKFSNPSPTSPPTPISSSSGRQPSYGLEPPPKAGLSAVSTPNSKKIYYIFCRELFKRTIMREAISNLNFDQDSFELIIDILSHRHKYPLDEYAFEFYSHEGYPLSVNKFSAKFPLCKWKLVEDSLLYVFVRKRVQPLFAEHTSNSFVDENNEIDIKSGALRVKIYSQLFDTFTVNINHNDSLITLKKKVSICTGIPLDYIVLYKSAIEYAGKLKDDDHHLENLESDSRGDVHLVLRIEDFVKIRTRNGLCKKQYNPTQMQTDRGIAKFYSILLYLVRSESECHRKFVLAILKYSSCPPLAYAFDQLFQENSIKSLSHIVALFEGFLQLSQAILEYFCTDVQPEKTLEFCDYVFGHLLKISKEMTGTSSVETEVHDCRCPITHRQILNPVVVPNSTSVYERVSVEEKIRSRLGLPHLDDSTNLELGDITPAEEKCAKFLMYMAFFDSGISSGSSFTVWKSPPKALKEIPTIIVSCTWKELNEAISQLKIQPPNELSSKKYCLTCVDKGQFVFYTEPVKSADKQVHVFNPISDQDETFSDSKMNNFASDWKKKAFHRLIDYLNPKIKASINTEELERSITLTTPNLIDSNTNKPEEAIMVLFDCSSSMNEKIFQQASSSTVYSKMTAAKELFYAFANRTDAYGFNHVVGLITFASNVSVKVQFTPIMDSFKSVVGELVANGRTALNEALKEAANKLNEFVKNYPDCKKRILCLTDGENNCDSISAWDITNRLQREKVVVDTILITASGNLQQKAISHATGGFCFNPSNLQQATRLFEMEVLLRFQDRSTPIANEQVVVNSKKTLEKFQNVQEYPYDTTNPYEFKTNFASSFDELTSHSAKKMVNLATFMGHSSSATTGSSGECVRRVVLEARNYIRNPHPAVDIFPGKNNVLHWKILLKGPDDCPYTGGVFLLLAKFPQAYPSKPPEIRFVTPIYHCNINSSGRICHPILGRNYLPSMTIRSIIDHIYGLLMAPEPFDPLDSVLAAQYHDSRAEYEDHATQHTIKYAKRLGWDELKKELTEDEDLDVAEGLVCPLTNRLFEDPVLTPHGFTYERKALIDLMKRNGNRDPLAHKPMRVEDLVPQRAIKGLADDIRKSNLRQ